MPCWSCAGECNLSLCKKQTEQAQSRKQQHREEQIWAHWPHFIHSLPLWRVLLSQLIPGTGRKKILLQEYWSQVVPFFFLFCTLLGRGKELEQSQVSLQKGVLSWQGACRMFPTTWVFFDGFFFLMGFIFPNLHHPIIRHLIQALHYVSLELMQGGWMDLPLGLLVSVCWQQSQPKRLAQNRQQNFLAAEIKWDESEHQLHPCEWQTDSEQVTAHYSTGKA